VTVISATMLTLFTIPKPFRGHIGMIQRNAIKSWTMITPRPEIILFGDEEGTAQTSTELGVQYIPRVSRNDQGTPLVNDLFEKAQQLATHHIICYANADIILMNDLMDTVRQVARRMRRFLIVGQRWDLDVSSPLDFGAGWEQKLRARVARDGCLHPPTGIDYFVFPRGLWGEIPSFSIGRTVWDNWLPYRARSRGASLVDATKAVTAVHQNHDYSHIPGGKDGAWRGIEARRNQELAGDIRFTVEDATHILLPRRLKCALDWSHTRRQLKTLHLFHPHLQMLARLLLRTIELADRARNRFGIDREHH